MCQGAGNLKGFAGQLWEEASTGFTRKGFQLDDEQRLARITKLKENAVTLAPRYRNAQLARVVPLEQRLVGLLTATVDEVNNHTTTAIYNAIDPLVARAEGRAPPRREGQTATERKHEIDATLLATRLLREERRRLVEEERVAKAEARPKRRRVEPDAP